MEEVKELGSVAQLKIRYGEIHAGRRGMAIA